MNDEQRTKFYIMVNHTNYLVTIYNDGSEELHAISQKYDDAYPHEDDGNYANEFYRDYIITSDGFILSVVDYNLIEQFCKEHCINGGREHPVDVIVNLLMYAR